MKISKRALRRARGKSVWTQDEDGWLVRPLRNGDRPAAAFSNSCHAFIEHGLLACRNRRQAALLDCGGLV